MHVFRLYGALLVVDPEEEFFSDEITKLHADVRARGLGLIVVADWYVCKWVIRLVCACVGE